MNTSLLLNFCKQDLIDRYSGSILGGAWSFVMPLVNILIFTLVFSKIMGARLEFLGAEFTEYSYSIYLVAGMLAWNAFANTLLRVTNIFNDKGGLIAKVNMSLLQLPLYIVLTETVIFIISLVFFVGFLLLIDFPITIHWLLIPVVFVVQQLLAFALGFIFATLSVFIRDIREFINVILQLWFWFTPIVYIVDILPESARQLFSINPMYLLVSAYRDLVLFHQLPNFSHLVALLAFGGCLMTLGVYVFRKLERDIRDFI
ncbi:ABC transporter permease [Motiliproteus sp. MSK22-1]|uniref:ABC transporter permease n=1 Tax=Motiliproteus sp. MSK22-1 TaxID=1897630 RepID=UPI000975548B|nr:ABC transporter permease [Motiliproteus sp. MSK22-1]OMH30457.1 ABC transporter permease [Motiliproteus sp. MSK22-1]